MADETKLKYIDTEGNAVLYPYTGNRQINGNNMSSYPIGATPATSEEIARDELGFTNPNLHRKIMSGDDQFIFNTQNTSGKYHEVEGRKYKAFISGLSSYRTVEMTTHDEDSVTSEIP